VIRAVLDTDTIVSGVGWGGPPGAVLDAALAGHFEIVTSPALLDELRRVLGYPKLPAVIGDAEELIELLALTAIVVTPTETVELVRDPDDNRLIEAALTAQADAIVTGDQDLLTLEHVDQIRILTPREFLGFSTTRHLNAAAQTPPTLGGSDSDHTRPSSRRWDGMLVIPRG